MPRDENITAGTSGRSGDIGDNVNGGKAGDDPLNALKSESPEHKTPVSERDKDANQAHGTPDDLKLGTRRTVGMNEDDGASDFPGATASD
jgi:hypothetical protein